MTINQKVADAIVTSVVILAAIALNGSVLASPAPVRHQVPSDIHASLPSGGGGEEGGRVTDGIRLYGEARAVKVTQGMPLVVTGTLTNLRTSKIVLAKTDPLGGFRFVIHGPKGSVVKINASGANLIKLQRRSSQQLAPGQATQQSVWISSLYALKQPGKYSITLTHAVPSSSGLGLETIKSNAFFVVIAKAGH